MTSKELDLQLHLMIRFKECVYFDILDIECEHQYLGNILSQSKSFL